MDQLRANRTTAGNDMNEIESPQEHMWNMTTYVEHGNPTEFTEILVEPSTIPSTL